MRVYCMLFLTITLMACDNQGDIKQFRTGQFKTILEDSQLSSTAFRNDSIQIEKYNNKSDTFSINWKSNFEYVLTKINPKTELDSTPFYVQITGFDKNSYQFKAYYKGSNFKQKGEAVKHR